MAAATSWANFDTHPQSRRSFTENQTPPCHSFEFQRPGPARKRQMVMMASGPAGKLSFGPDRQALAQALAEGLIKASGHSDFDHLHK